MNAQKYDLTALAPKLVFGKQASRILDELGARYERETGVKPRHWVLRVYSNGAVVPTPTQITGSMLPDVRVRQLFKQTLDKIARVDMHHFDEPDKFNLYMAGLQLQELSAPRGA